MDVVCSGSQTLYFQVLGRGHWCKSEKDVDLLSKVVWIHRGSEEHLRRTLRVTDVRERFEAGLCKDEVNEGWDVLNAHLKLIVVPVVLVVR